MQSLVLSRERISSVYALVIPVRPLFAPSSFAQSTGTHSDIVIGTALRRACGASCIRLTHNQCTHMTQKIMLIYSLSLDLYMECKYILQTAWKIGVQHHSLCLGIYMKYGDIVLHVHILDTTVAMMP